MRLPPSLLLGLALLAGVPPSASALEGALSGHFALAGATAVDPPPGEPRDTHFVVELEGDAARTLWNAMKARAVRDACLDDGSQSKTIGGMRCTRLAGRDRYRCGFAIDVARQRLVASGAC